MDPDFPASSLPQEDRLNTALGPAGSRDGFGLAGDGPVVELIDTSVPGRIVAAMPSGPYRADVAFLHYVDPESPADPVPQGTVEILIVPSYFHDGA